MANHYFRFKEFTVWQDKCAMKVCTDSCILGAFAANEIGFQNPSPTSILDIGGGTGLLSLMLAQKSAASVIAVESDPNAFEQMQQNFQASEWKERLLAIQQDIRKFETEKRFNIIISNPPFFENDLKGTDESKNLAKHDSGLLLSKLIKIISNLLMPGGKFFLMVPWLRKDYLLTLLEESGLGIESILNVGQTPGHKPFRSIISGVNQVRENKNTSEQVLIIQDKNGYTDEFKKLLNDYYLYL